MSSKAIKDIRNFFGTPSLAVATTTTMATPATREQQIARNVGRYISPIQFARIRNDIAAWRAAILEAELAWFPHRVRMQRIFQDTILNEHIDACMEKRRDLTLLRDFEFIDESETPDDELKKLFQSDWFTKFQYYALDAIFYGYSLVSLGDVINDRFPDLTVIKRHHISPDRLNVTSIIYQIDGVPFTQEPYNLWHVWVPTPTDLGVSACGYGLLYKIAKTEMYLRNTIESNVDGIELFGQPIRKGKTTKTEEGERSTFEAALRNMGSNAWILLDEGQDELELMESKNIGTAYKIYEDFETRAHKKISKILLGHADAMDSTAGKLGAEQGGEESPAQLALNDKQVKDGTFMENIINNQLLPRMRQMGFRIPLKNFRYVNNKEKEEFRRKEDNSNKVTAEIAQTMKNAGLLMDAAYFQERTGIPTEKAPEPSPMLPGAGKKPGDKQELQDQPGLSDKAKNRLKKIYSTPNKASQ